MQLPSVIRWGSSVLPFSFMVRLVLIPALLMFLAAVLVRCSPVEDSIPLDPPEGWTNDGTRWWRVEQDTVGIFRNLETLRAMNVLKTDGVYAGSSFLAQNSEAAKQGVVNAVKQSLIALFRTQPEIVDSLFILMVEPDIMEMRLQSNARKVVNDFKKQGYRSITRVYREPRTITHLGPDIPLPYPDSLRSSRIGGQVRIQTYVDAEGHPVAIEVIEGVHPVLDRIALRVTTQMRWQPAYLLRGGSADPIASWSRYKVHFLLPPGPEESTR